MTWAEYKEDTPPISSNWQLTDVDCPECGKKIWRRTDIVLTSYPPQYVYECDCGWSGTAFK